MSKSRHCSSAANDWSQVPTYLTNAFLSWSVQAQGLNEIRFPKNGATEESRVKNEILNKFKDLVLLRLYIRTVKLNGTFKVTRKK